MKRLIQLSIVLSTVFVLPATSRGSIEGVASPVDLNSLGNIYRFALFRRDNKILYGECDTLESHCTPDSELLTIKREMPYEEYVGRLAEHFGVNKTYLLHHARALESTWAYLDTLSGIESDHNADSDEKSLAESKKDAVLDAGGMLDRFLQALHIKLSLDEKPSNEFEGQRRLLKDARSRVQGSHAGRGTERSAYSVLQSFFGDMDSVPLSREARQQAQAYRQIWEGVKEMEGSEDYADQIVQALLDASYLRSQQSQGKIGPLLTRLAREKSLPIEINPAEDFQAFGPVFRKYMDERGIRVAIAGPELQPLGEQGNVTYEQSVKQFEQAFWPVNYASLVEGQGTDAKTRFEPSTLRTWHLGHSNTGRKDADALCAQKGRGWRLGDQPDIQYSAPWILQSSLGSEMGYTQGARIPVWLPAVRAVRGRHLRTVKKQVEIYRNHFEHKDVAEHELEIQFSYMMVGGPSCEVRTAKIGTGQVYEFSKDYSYEEMMAWAPKAGEAAVLCFKEKFK